MSAWELVRDRVPPHHRHYHCARHGYSWAPDGQRWTEGGLHPAPQIGIVVWHHCPDCARNPTMPPDLERPDYWTGEERAIQSSGMAVVATGLHCEHHGVSLQPHEGCRTCLEEDLGEDELEGLLAADSAWRTHGKR